VKIISHQPSDPEQLWTTKYRNAAHSPKQPKEKSQ